MHEIRRLIVQMATENRHWGYTRIRLGGMLTYYHRSAA